MNSNIKMDKKTVIAVEVDGYFYHKEGTAQEKRDKVKDRILEKYGITLKNRKRKNKYAILYNKSTYCSMY